MRNLFQSLSNISVTYLILGAAAGLFLMASAKPALWLYPLARQAVYLKIDYSTEKMLVKETEHFIIKYSEPDSQAANIVADAAEAAYNPVGRILRYLPPQKTLILVHKDKDSMQNAYGWASSASALGFYWGGVIQVLSPSAWGESRDSSDLNAQFIKQGPIAHEFTHLVLDHLINGNYSRWFTEGLAQYVEYLVNGYEWINNDNSLNQKWYSMSELDESFDQLPNQALAYRQSLALIRYIIETYGEEVFHQILLAMKGGVKTDKAIGNVLNISYPELENKAMKWAKKTMNY